VLALVSPVTYSIAGLCKRIFVIVVAIVWFGQKVSFLQCTGIVLTFVGL
jgi:solute carrier family 35 protein E1